MMALLLWTLSVFSLYRVMDQHVRRNANREESRKRPLQDSASIAKSLHKNGGDSLIQIRDGLQRDTAETWVGWRFRSMVSGSFVVSLVLAVFVFAAFPRVWVPGAAAFAADATAGRGAGTRSGFNNTVTLGRVGRIQLSQQRVLFFSVTSMNTGNPVSAEQFASAMDMDEVRFRGSALGFYNGGTWSVGIPGHEFSPPEYSRDLLETSARPGPEFLVEITQDPPVGNYAFAPYPVLSVKVTGNTEIRMRSITGTMNWGRNPGFDQPRTFSVQCPRIDPTSDVKPTFEFWTTPHQGPSDEVDAIRRSMRRFARELYLTPNIDNDLPRLQALTNQLCTKDGRRIPESDRVRAVMQYLSAENGFKYSTMQTRQDQTLDPVEDFLFNTKSGHCEYFASACALMLQSVQVPARLVNGYYGSELNSMTGKNEIRQLHAHSWVEVYLDDRWQTLEPTPAAPRRETVSAAKTDSLMSSLQTAISDLWNDGVHNMSAERQKKFFAPVISTSKSMLDSIRQQGLLRATWNEFQSFLKSPESWFSWRGGVATFVLLFVGGLISRLHPWERLRRMVQAVLARFSEKQRARRSVIRFYARFCSVCEQHGMRLSTASSALENGRSAILRFGERLQSEELRQIPIRIATAFNEVRFGKAELTDEQAASIGKDLSNFANALSYRQSLSA
ncbi:MAG: DUF3488 domain-containing protein, partial [Fuerstia sp.]|nr:DUF3488 domain-containing protein [Fuerstiella sp.]